LRRHSRMTIIIIAVILLSINILGAFWLINQSTSDAPPLPTLASVPNNVETVSIDPSPTSPYLIDDLPPAPLYAVESETWERDIESAQLEQVSRRTEVSNSTVENQHILQFDPSLSAEEIESHIQALDVEVVDTIGALNQVVVISSDSDVTQLQSDVIVNTEPDYYASALLSMAPTDPHYDLQWNLNAIGIETLWQYVPESPLDVTIAVIDSGICYDHPDMPTTYTDFQYDYVENDTVPQDVYGHGCGVAGVIASQNNTIGTVGIAPFANIMPLRVLDENGIGAYSDIARAIIDATDNGADIINLSLGGAQQSQTLQSAVNYALDRDVILVGAAGNSNGDTPLYPARYDGVIAVGSVNQLGEVSDYNHLGIELFAPGDGILIPHIDNDTIVASGTSVAAPHVAGVIAIKMMIDRPFSPTDSVLVDQPTIISAETKIENDPDAPYVMGDILVPRDQVTFDDEGRAQFTYGAVLWPNDTVYYLFDPEVSQLNRDRTRVAMDHWEATSNVQFIPRTTESDFLYIQNSNGNNSYVGTIGGGQVFNMVSWEYRYVIVHELGHALGLWHEQSRRDRDLYVDIIYSEIESGYADQFDIVSFAGTVGDYDFASVMHYYQYAFSRRGNTTISIPNNIDRARWQNLMGQNAFMSELDAIGMWLLYPCDPDRISLDCITLPTNDIVEDALFVDTPEYSHSLADGYGTVFATTSVDDPFPSCAIQDIGKTVWYTFSLPASEVTISTAGSNYDTILSVWTGERGNFTEVACSADANGTLTSELTFIPEENETYYIQVAGEYWRGYYTETSSGSLVFNLDAEPACMLWDDWLADPDPPTEACPPFNPDNLIVTVPDYTEQVNLNWRDNSTSETEFIIERSPHGANTWTQIDTVSTNTTTYTDTTAACYTEYDYRVTAYRSDDDQYSEPTALATAETSCSIVTAPTGLWRNSVTRNVNQLGWTDNSPDETKFLIERSPTGEGTWALAGEVTRDEERFIDDTGILCGLTYDYRVSAYREEDDNTSAPTNVVSDQLICDPPLAPSDITADDIITTTNLIVSWQDNSNETAFFVERQVDGNFQALGSVDENVTTFTDTSAELECYTSYTYRVSAYRNTDAKSSDWTVGSGTTSCDSLFAPDNLIVTNTLNTIELSWDNNSPDGTSFKIERRETDGGTFAQIGTSPDTTYTDTGLCGISYDYRVRQYRDDDGIDSDYSSVTTAVQACSPPLMPESLTAVAEPLTTHIGLVWVDNAFNESEYRIERRPLGETDWQEVGTSPANSTGYTDDDDTMSCYTEYEYRVRAYRASDTTFSEYSNIATSKTWCDPTLIDNYSYTGTLTTGDATDLNAFPYPTCGTEVTQVSMWEYTPPYDYIRTVNTSGSNLDTVLAIVTDFGSLVQLVCNDDSSPNGTSATALNLNKDQRYIIIAGLKNGASGDITINMEHRTPTVTPQLPPTAIPTVDRDPVLTTIGIQDRGMWYFRDTNNSGTFDVNIEYGRTLTNEGWTPVVGDWNGDGTDGIGLYKNGRWRLRDMTDNTLTDEYNFVFGFNDDDWLPVVGDWEGDGTDGIGLYKDGVWLLKRTPSEGSPDYNVRFSIGDENARPIAGDWDGETGDEIGLYSGGIWYFSREPLGDGMFGIARFGPTDNTWYPVIGDWDEDGDDTIGIFKDGNWRLRNSNTTGSTDVGFSFGNSKGIPISGYRGGAEALSLLASVSDINTTTSSVRDVPTTTPEPSLTPLPTTTDTPITTPSPTITPSATVTAEPTATLTQTHTATPQPSDTPVPTSTPSPTLTQTELPPEPQENVSGT